MMSFVFNNNANILMAIVFVIYLIQLCVFMMKRYFSLSLDTIWIQLLVCTSYGASGALAFVRMLTITNKKLELALSILLPTLSVVWVFYHTLLRDMRTVTNVDSNMRFSLNKKKDAKRVVIDYGLTKNQILNLAAFYGHEFVGVLPPKDSELDFNFYTQPTQYVKEDLD